MPKLPRALTIAALCLCVRSSVFAQQKQTLELRGLNDWENVSPATTAPTTQPANDQTLDRVERYITDRQYLAGKRQAILWLKTHPKNPLRARAVYLLGQANFGLDDRLNAFYNFDEVLDLYPDSKLFNPALEREYEIANDYLNGRKKKFFGFRLFGMQDEGVEMLYRVQSRSPGSPLAEKALLRTGDYYYTDSQFDLAADVYAVFVKQYPRSPEVPRVRLRQAFSYYAQFRGLRFDLTPVIDAREQLANIVAEYPELAQKENLKPVIERIDDTFARKMLQTGYYYTRTHEPAAAAYTWRYLQQAYPASAAAKEAERELTKLPRWALATPKPIGAGPTTAPSADAR